MNHDKLISIEEDNLEFVAGGNGDCQLPSPCDVVAGVVKAGEELVQCGVKTIESLLCAKVDVKL